ncbi:MAG TPA: Ig-like domain-containing protein [Polyangiaceae bacterium]|nr:Ig-like domain-containing protein [Polyangiaceae bacterium]
MQTQSARRLALLPFLFGLSAACGATAEKHGAPALPSTPSEAGADDGPAAMIRPYQVDVPRLTASPGAGGANDAETAPGSSVEPNAAGAAGTPASDDETVAAPRIVSVSPSNGATGVRADERIAIEFSQPMDRRATAAAWRSDTLPRSAVDFAWNDTGTTLIVTPKQPLEYAHTALNDDERMELAARGYDYTLSGQAADGPGHALAETTVRFSTLREISHTLHSFRELSGVVSNPERPEELAGFVTVDLAPLPAGIRMLEHAVARTSEYRLLAPVVVSQVAFARLDASALTAQSRGVVTTLPAGTSGDLLVPQSLWHFLAADYRARNAARTFTQYRFDLPPGSDGSVVAKLLEDASLELDYLVP